MNLNKLFPRLPLRAKLTVAFTVIALLPLLLVAVATIRVTVARLRELAQATLEHDLQTTREQAERAIEQAVRDIGYVADGLVGPAPALWAGSRARQEIEAFLVHTPALFQVKALSPDGQVLAVIRRGSDSLRLPAPEDGEGVYYAVRAASLGPREHLVLPVELRTDPPTDLGRTLPALAVVRGVHDAQGILRTVVVGESRASVMLGALDRATPQFSGTTILSDQDQHLLYHSEEKRDWSSLLASEALAPRPAKEAAGSSAFRFRAGDEVVLSMPLRLGGTESPALTLSRAVPIATLNRPITDFLIGVVVTGALVLLLVLVAAFVAARELSEPLYRLREAARRLEAGDPEVEELGIATNDEIEDLASAFTTMARALTRHRRDLESLVAERTHDLERTHAELRDVLAHSADAIIVLDTRGCIRIWNDGAERLFGYRAEEVLGRECNALLLPVGASDATEARFLSREMTATGAVENLVTRRRARDGSLVPVSLTQSRITDATGQPHGTSLILRDMSMQRKVEDQMRRSERLAVVSVLAAGVAHEINNPLAIIQNRLECMAGELEEGQHEIRRDLLVLQEHTARLSEVTRNLLRFARDYDHASGPVDLLEVMRRLARLLERTLVGREVSVRVIQGGSGRPAWGSESALETVGLNLLLNAADAMPRGGAITVSERSRDDGMQVELVVDDEGPGVPPELRERIFEPFFTTKDDVHGTGLGLAVCRSIVERLGGQIWVEPAQGGGSRFVVAVPAAAEVAV